MTDLRVTSSQVDPQHARTLLPRAKAAAAARDSAALTRGCAGHDVVALEVNRLVNDLGYDVAPPPDELSELVHSIAGAQ